MTSPGEIERYVPVAVLPRVAGSGVSIASTAERHELWGLPSKVIQAERMSAGPKPSFATESENVDSELVTENVR